MFKTVLEQATCLLRVSSARSCIQQQIRTTVVMRRMYPVKLQKQGAIDPPALKKREWVYIMEENTSRKPAGNMEVLMTKDIEGVGLVGEVVTVSKALARNTLLPSGQAVYPSEYNLTKFKRKETGDKAQQQSKWGLQTLAQLRGMHVDIPMSSMVSWTLEKSHVRIAFRRAGVQLDDDCLSLPEEPITEPGTVTITVTVNKLDQVQVQATVWHYHLEDIPDFPPRWTSTKKTKITKS